jgi:hypothetical protein
MSKTDNDIFVAKTRFHGVFGFGYGTLKSSNLIIPLMASTVIKEFHMMKL